MSEAIPRGARAEGEEREYCRRLMHLQPLELYIAVLARVLSILWEKVVSEASPRGAEGFTGEHCLRLMMSDWNVGYKFGRSVRPSGGILGVLELVFTIVPISILHRSRLVPWTRGFPALSSNFPFHASFSSSIHISHLEGVSLHARKVCDICGIPQVAERKSFGISSQLFLMGNYISMLGFQF